MKSKLFARILCIVLCVVLVVSVLLVAIPMIRGSAAETEALTGEAVTFGESVTAPEEVIPVYEAALSGEEAVESPGITISVTEGSLYVGCQYAFWQTGAVSPVWTSSDERVDQNGVLTAKHTGKTTVTCAENGNSATCELTVTSASPLNLSAKALELPQGAAAVLTSRAKNVKWYSSNHQVAAVSNGAVTAVGAGYATVTAYTDCSASTCLVHVSPVPQDSGMRLNVSSGTLYVGCQYAFWQTGADTPAWSSSDPTVATVDQNGVVTAKSAGYAVITSSEGEKSARCVLTVKPGAPTGVTPPFATIEKGKTATLHCTLGGVKWYSSNPQVATVSNGLVTAKGVGYATIAAYTDDRASTCLVRVYEPQQPVTQPTTAAPTTVAPTTVAPTDPKPTEPDPEPIPTPTLRGRVTASSVNLRSGAGTGFSILTTLTKNTEFTFISETVYNNGWYHIRLDNGTEGYISKDYIEKLTPPVITLCIQSGVTYTGCQYALWQTGAEYPEWRSSNPSVATIEQNGVLTAKSAGTTTVTASENGGVGSCVITVKNGVSTGISAKTLTLAAGKTATLTAQAGVSWFSSNTNVATVSGGVVTAKSVGCATISAYNGSGASTCLVTVTEGTGTIKFLGSSASVFTGCRYAIPCTGTNGASWSSSNTTVATVDQNGVVTARSAGSAVIRAANAVSSASFTVKVSSGYAPGISSSGETIAAGKSILLDSDSNVSWSSSNTNIATVKNGVVNTKAAGWVTISAYTSYGASTCLLHVTPPDNIRFTFASPNSAPKGATVTFKAITDRSRTAVRFVVTNGSTSYTVDATSKTADGSKNYIWSGSRALSLPGIWTVKAYAKTASSDYATTPEGGEGEVFITNATDTTTTVLGERRASDGVIKMIAEFEGFLPTITGDYITGDPTIGHGKVIWDNEQFYNDLTENEAYAYLCRTVNSGPYTSVTNNFLTSNNVRFNQNQFDALVCFAYNVGAYALTNDATLKSALLGSTAGGTVKAGGAGYINTSEVNLRAGAGTSYSVVKTMAYNTRFTFTDGKLVGGEWYQIKLTDGTTGYVYASYASPVGAEKDLKNTDKETFTQRLLQFHHAAGSCYYGLLWRRVDEVEMFFYGDYVLDGSDNKHHIYFRCSGNSSFGVG